ncbi:MAG: rhodanese-like domain-containing protein [Phycisphaerae bacterium]
MAAFVVRTLLILGVSVGASAVFVPATGNRWTIDQAALAKEQELKKRIDHVQDDAKRLALKARAGIDVEQLRALVAGGALVIDARTPDLFAKGHLKADLVINVPAEEVTSMLGALTPDAVQGRPIVIYCNSEDCPLSEVVFEELERAFGYPQMYIFFPGWTGIEQAGLEIATPG